jgi:hypothetical protein
LSAAGGKQKRKFAVCCGVPVCQSKSNSKIKEENTMKKTLLMAVMLLVSGAAAAETDHYVLRDGNHVRHLKIHKLADEITVTADVDFEPNANETAGKPCSAEIIAKAKSVAENELLMKKHSESEASYCELKIHLTGTGATVEQSADCDNFVAGICRFATDGKELVKIK